MISITENAITITLEHVCPDEVVRDLQQAIIKILQNLDLTSGDDILEIFNAQYFLLELLKALLEKES